MPSSLHRVVRHARAVCVRNDEPDVADAELLRRFVAGRDGAAFAALVGRHGPLVWGVCRRHLSEADAEDAFQATFLVLVRKAGSVRSPESLAGWLHGVAYHVARRVKAANAKRRAKEASVVSRTRTESVPADVLAVLDRELAGLPEIYRLAVLVCDLEGKTRKEAARQLGVAEGTVASRLARGRVLLARRLAKHGITLSAGALTLVLAQTASAGVPPAVMSSTVAAAGLMATGHAAISPRVAGFVEGALKDMVLAKLKRTAAALLAAVVVCGLGVSSYPAAPAGRHAPVNTPKPAEADDAVKPDQARLAGKWAIVTMENGGVERPLAENGFKEYTLTFTKGTVTTAWTRERDGESGGGETPYALDPSKRPKQLTIASPIPIQALYTLEGDTLRLCFLGLSQAGRPREFRTGPGIEGNPIIWTLKRVPAGK